MFDSDFIANSYKFYSRLHTGTALFWAEKFRNGAWLVTRYADVRICRWLMKSLIGVRILRSAG